MDAPPAKENSAPFLHVAQLLRAAGVHAPEVLAADLDRGFLLLTDLGNRTYLAALDAASAPALYSDAIDALIRWQLASREDELPPYDEALLQRELDLFPDWYVARHLGLTLTAAQAQTLADAFRRILDNNLAQPRVFVHRDYHSRNLMVCEPTTPASSISRTRSTARSPTTSSRCCATRTSRGTRNGRSTGPCATGSARASAGLPVGADFGAFWRDFEWMGVQRQLKVLGIFARLYHRDGKTGYLGDMPRVMAYLRGACARYRALGPLLALLDELEGRAAPAGYTF